MMFLFVFVMRSVCFIFMILMVLLFPIFFFFKQKTAYEMRISDWSSDVCSSDLRAADADGGQVDDGGGDSDLALRDLLLLPHRGRAGVPAPGRATVAAPPSPFAPRVSRSVPMAGGN